MVAELELDPNILDAASGEGCQTLCDSFLKAILWKTGEVEVVAKSLLLGSRQQAKQTCCTLSHSQTR